MNRMIAPHVKALVSQFVPEHVRDRFPKFVEFIQAYLDFLETTHRSAYFQNTLQHQRNIELQEEEFLAEIEKEIGLFVPFEWAATPRVFYHKISELWRSKGSEEAIQTFFRLFLDQQFVQIRYPWEKVLKPSDGRWMTEKRLRVSMIQGDPNDFVNQRIHQIEQYGVTYVTNIDQKVYDDGIIYELTILREQTAGEFFVGNRITVEGKSVEAEIYNSLQELRVVSGGSNYRVGDRVRYVGRSKNTFEGRVNMVDPDTGAILSVAIIDHGSGTTPNHIRADRIAARAADPLNKSIYRFYFEEFDVYDFIELEREVEESEFPPNHFGQEQIDLRNKANVFDSGSIYIQSYIYDPEADGFYFAEDYIGRKTQFFGNYGIETMRSFIEVVSDTGTGAVLESVFGPIVSLEGHYVGVHGQLSESIVLQDSYFYQKFSYEVISQRDSIQHWRDALKRTVHPAGTIPFALVNAGFSKIEVFPEFVVSAPVRILMPVTLVYPVKSGHYVFTKVLGKRPSVSNPDYDEGTVLFRANTAIEQTKVTSDSVGAGDEGGSLYIQNYVEDRYFAEDYIGQRVEFP